MVAAADHRGDWDAPEAALRIAVSERAGWAIVSFTGDLDLDEAPAARAALDVPPERAPRGVVADLSGLAFLGSTGARMLVEAADLARAEGRALRVVQGTGPARRLLGLLGLGERLDVLDPG